MDNGKATKEAMLDQAEWLGDSMAAAALQDLDYEEGIPSMRRFQPGEWIVIFTGAFFHVGKMTGEDHEYIGLDDGSVQVFETGYFSDFFGLGVADYCAPIPKPILVRKGPITHLAHWPFDRPCIQRNQNSGE